MKGEVDVVVTVHSTVKIMMKLETERLVIRNYKHEDFNDIFNYFSIEEVSKYEDFYPMSETEVKELIDEWSSLDNRLVAVLKGEQKVIGSVGYFVDDDGDYSIDYDFNPKYWRKGYATEAAKEVLRYLIEEKNVEIVYGDCDIRNESSWKLMEKLGFERIEQNDNESYKDDADGNPIVISVYYYKYTKKIINTI